jgi:hypothetical protein
MPKFVRPSAPPSPLFLNKPEKDFQEQISQEVTEYIINNTILYFPVDVEKTNFHPIYKEAIDKIYLQPIFVNVIADYEDNKTVTTKYGKDRRSTITIHFPKRRISDDLDLYVREGDLIFYNDEYSEIYKLTEPEELYGHIDTKVGITAYCVKSRNPPLFRSL